MRKDLAGLQICANGAVGSSSLQVQAAALRLWKPIAGERDDYIANPKV